MPEYDGYFLALDGQIIALKRLDVSVRLDIRDEDASGKSSATTTSEQGIKAKTLRISGLIPFSDRPSLSLLFRLAEATGSGGEQHVYRIGNRDAKSAGMLQGIFSGGVGAVPEQGLMAWKVDFTLRERLSAAEKNAARRSAADAGTASGGGSTPPAAGQEQPAAPDHHGWFYSVSKKINDFIGPGGSEVKK